MERLLVTGGAGFIGSNFLRLLLAEGNYELLNFDKLTYAGNLANLRDLETHPRYAFMRGDVADRQAVDEAFRTGIDGVVHFAAESHVDRSLEEADAFLRTNVQGTQVLLDGARHHGVERFLQVSTDEVYGSLGPTGAFTESSPLAPNSVYSASKASADLLVRAAHVSFGLPVLTTRSSNNYGPHQFPEKLVPLMISNALEDRPLPVYGDGGNVRDWIHVEDHCRAIWAVLEKGEPGSIYNVGSDHERTNLAIVKKILEIVEKPESLIRFVGDRPGHDRRYAIEARKIRQELGWAPRWTFDEGLEATVRWYVENESWWRDIKSGAYRDYYARMYGKR